MIKSETGVQRWIVTPRPRSAPRIRLVCFLYAGGGTGVYRPWGRQLPDDVELSAVQLPGRDRRLAEPPMRDIRVMAAHVGRELGSLGSESLVLFGHSMGALLAYEVAHWLHAKRQPAPRLLAVSGWSAPHLPNNLHRRDDRLAVLRLEGTPPEVLAHRNSERCSSRSCGPISTRWRTTSTWSGHRWNARSPLSAARATRTRRAATCPNGLDTPAAASAPRSSRATTSSYGTSCAIDRSGCPR